MITPEQMLAARALLRWTRDDLAKHSGVATITALGFDRPGHRLCSDVACENLRLPTPLRTAAGIIATLQLTAAEANLGFKITSAG